MADIATLGIAVDSSGVDRGAKALDALATSSAHAETAAKKLETSISSANKMAANDNGFRRAAEAMKLTSYEMRNLGFQMNDVATMLSMGASPFQVLASQGGQLFQIIQMSEGGVRGFGSAVAALINPTNLVAAGLLAAGAGAIWWMARTVDATSALESHADRMKAVKTAYEGLVKGQEGVTASTVAMQEALLGMERRGLETKLKDISASLKGGIGARATSFGAGDQFSAIGDALKTLYANIEAGTPKFVEFQQQMAGIINTDPSEHIQKVARALFDLVDQGAKVEVALRGAANGIEAVGGMSAAQLGSIRAFNGALGSLMSMVPEAAKAIEAGKKVQEATRAYERGQVALRDELSSGAIGGLEFAAGMGSLKKAYDEAIPSISGVTAEQKKLDDQIEASKARLSDSRLGSKLGAIDAAYAREVEDIRKMSATGASTEEIDRLIGKAKSYRDVQVQLANQNESFKSSGGGETDAEKFDRIVVAAQGRIDLARTEAAAIGMTAEAALRMKTEQELLNQARRADIELTPQQIQTLRDLAAESASTTTAMKRQRDVLAFEKDLFGGALSTMRQGLMNGTDAWASFGDAAMGVLDKIIGKIENQLIDAIFSAGGGGGTGLFSFLFSANGNAFGSGGVHAFANGGAFTNSIVSSPTLFRFANGTGLMGEAGPEAIMPLKRDGSGRLGVSAPQGVTGGGAPISISIGAPAITVNGSVGNAEVQQLRAELAADRKSRAADTVRIVNEARSRGHVR